MILSKTTSFKRNRSICALQHIVLLEGHTVFLCVCCNVKESLLAVTLNNKI